MGSEQCDCVKFHEMVNPRDTAGTAEIEEWYIVSGGEKTHVRGSRSVSPPSRLTQPRTPNLTARGRHRPTHFLSQEQLEAQEVEDMKQ